VHRQRVQNTCQAPTCTDTLKNGTETDVDCGGTCPNDCAIGQGCMVDGDCQSGTCTAGVCSLLNGCDLSTAQDFTVMAPPPITFANGNLTYAPKCIKVPVGTVLTFNGNFAGHPTIGGTVVGNVVTPAASGPFVPVTSTGTTKDFTMSTVGTFPYYCQPHATLGMTGVVYVVP
jgi:plastocyanin